MISRAEKTAASFGLGMIVVSFGWLFIVVMAIILPASPYLQYKKVPCQVIEMTKKEVECDTSHDEPFHPPQYVCGLARVVYQMEYRPNYNSIVSQHDHSLPDEIVLKNKSFTGRLYQSYVKNRIKDPCFYGGKNMCYESFLKRAELFQRSSDQLAVLENYYKMRTAEFNNQKYSKPKVPLPNQDEDLHDHHHAHNKIRGKKNNVKRHRKRHTDSHHGEESDQNDDDHQMTVAENINFMANQSQIHWNDLLPSNIDINLFNPGSKQSGYCWVDPDINHHSEYADNVVLINIATASKHVLHSILWPGVCAGLGLTMYLLVVIFIRISNENKEMLQALVMMDQENDNMSDDDVPPGSANLMEWAAMNDARRFSSPWAYEATYGYQFNSNNLNFNRQEINDVHDQRGNTNREHHQTSNFSYDKSARAASMRKKMMADNKSQSIFAPSIIRNQSMALRKQNTKNAASHTDNDQNQNLNVQIHNNNRLDTINSENPIKIYHSRALSHQPQPTHQLLSDSAQPNQTIQYYQNHQFKNSQRRRSLANSNRPIPDAIALTPPSANSSQQQQGHFNFTNSVRTAAPNRNICGGHSMSRRYERKRESVHQNARALGYVDQQVSQQEPIIADGLHQQQQQRHLLGTHHLDPHTNQRRYSHLHPGIGSKSIPAKTLPDPVIIRTPRTQGSFMQRSRRKSMRRSTVDLGDNCRLYFLTNFFN